MLENVKNVCVIGAGTMGCGIAAHLANLGFRVTLLDLTRESAAAAVERTLGARPPHFYVPETAKSLVTGSISDDIEAIRDADWICEAIVEKLDEKKALFRSVQSLVREDAMITTNTSGLEIALLAEDCSEEFQRKFMGTHFFNPPRYLKLLELIPTEKTDPQVIEQMAQFLEARVARRVVVAKDTPGFIANRFGMWSMIYTVYVAEKLGYSVEEVDAITGPFLGRPRTASFRLNDLVGIDIMQDIAENLRERCKDDPFVRRLQTPRSMESLLRKGWLGSKSGQGYFKKEGNQILALDLQTLAYRQPVEPDLPALGELASLPLGERLREGLRLRDRVGEFLNEYLPEALKYADYLKEEISHSVEDFDRVMKWGFGWEAGPFELIDGIGAENLGIETKRFYAGSDILSFGGEYVPAKVEPQYRTWDDFPLTQELPGIEVRTLDGGILAILLTTKMGVIGPGVTDELIRLIEGSDLDGFVLGSKARIFSAGFDLKFTLQCAQDGNYEAVEEALVSLQRCADLMRTRRSVAAIHGAALGAGYEIASGCSIVLTPPEVTIGLPESRVGLIPGGTGAALMRTRCQSGAKSICELSERLTKGSTASTAAEAIQIGYLTAKDRIAYQTDSLIQQAIDLIPEAEPLGEPEWLPVEGPLVGMIDRMLQENRSKGVLSEHDCEIGERIKMVLAKATSWEDALAKERAGLIAMLRTGFSQARIKHMLEHGKPLFN